MGTRARRSARARRSSSPVTARRLQALAADVESNRKELQVQFTRMAQIQAELDAIKKAWEKMKNGG